MNATGSEIQVSKVKEGWLLSRSIEDSRILRLWITGSRQNRYRFDIAGQGLEHTFMPNDEFDDAVRREYDPVRLPKPLRDSEYEGQFLQMRNAAQDLVEAAEPV